MTESETQKKTKPFLRGQQRDFDALSTRQMLATTIYFAINTREMNTSVDSNLQGPSFPLDIQGKVFWAAQTWDTWKIKQLLGPLLCDGSSDTDDFLVPLAEARKNQFCGPLMLIVSKDHHGDTRLDISHLGENMLFPIKHCRWCGLMTAKVFRVCSMCQECPEYHDRNYFCSDKCEQEALDKQHREEHARFYMFKLNMDV